MSGFIQKASLKVIIISIILTTLMCCAYYFGIKPVVLQPPEYKECKADAIYNAINNNKVEKWQFINANRSYYSCAELKKDSGALFAEIIGFRVPDEKQYRHLIDTAGKLMEVHGYSFSTKEQWQLITPKYIIILRAFAFCLVLTSTLFVLFYGIRFIMRTRVQRKTAPPEIRQKR